MDRERQEMIRKGLQPLIVTNQTLQFKSNGYIPAGTPVTLKPKWNGEPTVYAYHSHGILRRFVNWLFSCKQNRHIHSVPFGIADRDADEGCIIGITLQGRFSLN